MSTSFARLDSRRGRAGFTDRIPAVPGRPRRGARPIARGQEGVLIIESSDIREYRLRPTTTTPP
eukprot:4899897-Pyramimonas_sp.AAC.1